jgi:hypothetical protein
MRAAALFMLGALVASPAAATEWVSCASPGGEASFDYLAADGLDVLSIAAVTITAAERVWASDTANGPGDPVQIGQQFETADSIWIDAVDDAFAPIAELRLFKSAEQDVVAYGGTLRIVGLGAWPVSCDPGA